MQTTIDLLSNASATGAAKDAVFGGRYLLLVSGTFGGATVSVGILGPDGSTYITVPDSAKTAAGSAVIYLPPGATVKGVVAGGTPSALYASLQLTEGQGG